jgi:ankyrin repeat protein
MIVNYDKKNISFIEFLISQGADVQYNSGNQTPLTKALRSEQKEITSLLLEKGADPNVVASKMTPLMLAAYHFAKVSEKADVCAMLIKHGAKDSILSAAARGDVAAVKAFISSGISLDVQDDDGMTPLMRALNCREASFARFLIEKGADILKKDKDGKTALFYTVYCGSNDNDTYVVAQSLVDKKSDVNMRDKKGNTVLIYAKARRFEKLAEVLVKAGAVLNKEDEEKINKNTIFYSR